jgi:hypothetical protein
MARGKPSQQAEDESEFVLGVKRECRDAALAVIDAYIEEMRIGNTTRGRLTNEGAEKVGVLQHCRERVAKALAYEAEPKA